MITFGAKYIFPVEVEKVVNRKRCPYRTAFVELAPQSSKDSLSVGLTSNLIYKKTGYASQIHGHFSLAERGDIGFNKWVRFYALAEEQKHYNYVKPYNILGLIEVSSKHLCNNTIFINYIQAIKRVFFNKMHHVGTGMIDCIKEIYPDKIIELLSLPSAVKFYEANGFEIVERNKVNRLVRMRYSPKSNN